jgi:hypothetical protein
MTAPIDRPKSRPPATPAPAAEARPTDPAPAAASQAPAARALASNVGSSAAPTAFTQARSEPKPSPGLEVPSRLSRSSAGREAMALDSAPKQFAPDSAPSYPIKPQAEVALKRLNEDPLYAGNPDAKLKLGQFVDSKLFRALDGNAQAKALELFRANLPSGPGSLIARVLGGSSTPGLDRVKDVVDSLRTMSPVGDQGIGDVLTGLTKASPLSAETAEKTKALVQSEGFKSLSAADKQIVAAGLKDAKCDPKYAASLKGLLDDPKFQALKPEERTAILKRAKDLPDARTVDLFRANLGDKDALGRAHQACESLGNVKSTEGKMQVLEALGKGSPLSQDMLDKTKALLDSPKFAALSEANQNLMIEGLRNFSADPPYAESLKNLIEDPKLEALGAAGQAQAMALLKANLADSGAPHLIKHVVGQLDNVKSVEGKIEVLEGLAKSPVPLSDPDRMIRLGSLLNAPQFASLSDSDQRLVTGAVKNSKADPEVLRNTLHLLGQTDFQALGPAEKTAVLSQVNNYPDARSIENLRRLVQKDWFKDFDLGDKQRALKTVAWLSQHDSGNRAVIDNTLDKFLSPNAPYKMQFKDFAPPKVGTIFADAKDGVLNLNRGLLDADNKKVPEDGARKFLVLHCVAHEVNHLVNGGDPPHPTFEYLQQEYRAWYVGYMAEHGKPPSNDDAMGRWAYLLNPDGAYGDSSKGALGDSTEAAKIYAELTRITGMPVNAGNLQTVLKSDPATWPNPSTGKAPVPPGNLDNS